MADGAGWVHERNAAVNRPTRALLACWLCAAAPAVAGQGTAWEPSDRPVRVTTDTLEYCNHLLARVVEMRNAQEFPYEEVDRLTAEGRRMCAHGLVRRGIMRLRRALVMMQAEK